ncbi:MAG: hypothetical protein ACI9Y1_001855 [Lentisphaeria bacterium]|jgi:hypothetical protein
MCTTLENKREAALGFADVLEEKFTVTRQQLSVPIQSVWAMRVLQRFHAIPWNTNTHREEKRWKKN